MIKILYTCISNQMNEHDFEFLLNKVASRFKEKLVAYKRWQYAYPSLLGKLLLQHGLATLNLDNYKIEDIRYSSYKRPYLEGGIDFNISHSGSYVVCGLSNKYKLGIDIEEIKSIKLDDFKDLWTEDEWKQILDATNSNYQFYNYWTKKEALLKASGEGLSIPLRQVNLKGNLGFLQKKCWYFREVPISKDYIMHLATDEEIHISINAEEICFF